MWFLWFFLFAYFVCLFCPIQVCSFLFYLILLLFLIDACVFSNEREIEKKSMNLGGWGIRGNLGGVERGEP